MKACAALALAALLIGLPSGAHAAPGQAPSDPAAAQPAPAPRPLIQAGIGLVMGVPIGDFQDNVDFSAGLGGHLDFGIGESPVSIGAEASYLWYGSASRDVPLVGLPDLAVRVDTSNDMFLMHGRVRVQQPQGRVRPYVDGLVGFNYLVTSTSVDAEESCIFIGGTYVCDDDGDSITQLDDVVLSVGGGAGIQIAFGTAPSPARLDLSLRYLYGGEASYLTEEDLEWREEGVILRPRRSRTDLLIISVGVVWGR